MDIKEILSVSSMPGLYKLVSTRDNGIFVQPLEGGKTKFCSMRKYQFTPLETVAIYTMMDTVELKEVFKNMMAYEVNNEMVDASASDDELTSFFAEIIPDYDRNRVYPRDMKKVVKWYEILKAHGLLDARPSDEEE